MKTIKIKSQDLPVAFVVEESPQEEITVYTPSLRLPKWGAKEVRLFSIMMVFVIAIVTLYAIKRKPTEGLLSKQDLVSSLAAAKERLEGKFGEVKLGIPMPCIWARLDNLQQVTVPEFWEIVETTPKKAIYPVYFDDASICCQVDVQYSSTRKEWITTACGSGNSAKLYFGIRDEHARRHTDIQLKDYFIFS